VKYRITFDEFKKRYTYITKIGKGGFASVD